MKLVPILVPLIFRENERECEREWREKNTLNEHPNQGRDQTLTGTWTLDPSVGSVDTLITEPCWSGLLHYNLTSIYFIADSLLSFHYYIFDPLYPIHLSSTLFPSSNHHSVVCIYELVLFCFVLLVHLLLSVHRWMNKEEDEIIVIKKDEILSLVTTWWVLRVFCQVK